MNRSSGHGLVPGNAYENGSHAVKDMDMEVADGEFMVLVGPSGCGKTTTLRMVAGLEDTTSGILHIGGKVVNDETQGTRHRDGVPEHRVAGPQAGPAGSGSGWRWAVPSCASRRCS